MKIHIEFFLFWEGGWLCHNYCYSNEESILLNKLNILTNFWLLFKVAREIVIFFYILLSRKIICLINNHLYQYEHKYNIKKRCKYQEIISRKRFYHATTPISFAVLFPSFSCSINEPKDENTSPHPQIKDKKINIPHPSTDNIQSYPSQSVVSIKGGIF